MTKFDISQIPTVFEQKICEYLFKEEFNKKVATLKKLDW